MKTPLEQAHPVTITRKGRTFDIEDDSGKMSGLELLVRKKNGEIQLTDGRWWIKITHLCGPDIYSTDQDKWPTGYNENIGIIEMVAQEQK